MQSIILVTHCVDLKFLDVSSAMDCVQLALSIKYGLCMFESEEGPEKQAGLCICGISVWLWLIPADMDLKLQIRRWDVSLTLFSGVRYPHSDNHGPSLNCCSMCKCMRHLIKALWWQGAHAKSRNVYSLLCFEMRTCSPLVSICEMRESTAATK